MDIHVKTTSVGRHKDDALALLGTEGQKLTKAVASAGAAFRAPFATLVAREVYRGAAEDLVHLTAGADARYPSLLVGGLGPAKALRPGDVSTRAAEIAKRARSLGATSLTFALPEGRGAAFRADVAARAIVEGVLLGLYRFEAYKAKPGRGAVTSLTILAPEAARSRAQRGVAEGQALAAGVILARDLGNEPGNTATPTYLAERAAELAKQEGLDLRVFEEDEMREMGMGALLGVSRGSREPAKLIRLVYEPRRTGKQRPETIALVGKGLTFDAGGISIKPAAKMEDMKFDMCGGAAVLGAMRAVPHLGVTARVVALVPTSENLPDGNAYKPGDILRAMNGTTIEIRNTDAEGRLILADALCYATGRMRPRPKAVVDAATLTGSCVVALGDQHAALVSNDESLAERLLDASESSGDALWRMPLTEGHRRQLESPYADLSNLGTPGAGTLTAAAFLERFTDGVPWAHLDIAGMAWTGKAEGILQKGGTGFGVRVLARFCQGWGR